MPWDMDLTAFYFFLRGFLVDPFLDYRRHIILHQIKQTFDIALYQDDPAMLISNTLAELNDRTW